MSFSILLVSQTIRHRWVDLAIVAAVLPYVLAVAFLFVVALIPTVTVHWRLAEWQHVIVGGLLIAALLPAIVTAGVGVRSKLRTHKGWIAFSVGSVSIVAVVVAVVLWRNIMLALSIFILDGGWSAFGNNPPSGFVVGTVASPEKRSDLYVYLMQVDHVTSVTPPNDNGCFMLSTKVEAAFGVFLEKYWELKRPIGKGYFQVTVNLRSDSSPDAKMMTWKQLSAFEYIDLALDCQSSNPH